MLAPPPDTPVALPAGFFTSTLPAISDLAELRLTLHMYYRAAVGPALVAESALLADPALRRNLLPLGSARDPATVIRRGLELALSRGTLLAVRPHDPADDRRWYLLDTPAGRELVHQIETGQAPLPAPFPSQSAPPLAAVRPTIYRLYEQHIAALTPLVAQQLADAATEFPTDWIADAFDEAVARDRRSWRFVRYLLERWASEGREYGTHRRHRAQPLDPAKYTKGKYAALFQRRAAGGVG